MRRESEAALFFANKYHALDEYRIMPNKRTLFNKVPLLFYDCQLQRIKKKFEVSKEINAK